MRILLVDDDPDQLAMRAMLLAECGFDSMSASTPEAAIEIAENQGADCAVVDLRLPTPDAGIETLRKLREVHPKLRIFVLTGTPQGNPDVQHALRYAEGVITKGSGIAALLQALEESQITKK